MKHTVTTPATHPGPPPPYSGFDSMPIAGQWRKGRSQREIKDVDPYRGETLVAITGASADDVDEAYTKAAEAQRDWTAATPQTRRDVLLRTAAILIERKKVWRWQNALRPA